MCITTGLCALLMKDFNIVEKFQVAPFYEHNTLIIGRVELNSNGLFTDGTLGNNSNLYSTVLATNQQMAYIHLVLSTLKGILNNGLQDYLSVKTI